MHVDRTQQQHVTHVTFTCHLLENNCLVSKFGVCA
jgi:hypothetical protein